MLVSCAGDYAVRSDLMQCQGMSTMEDCGVPADMAGVWLARLHHCIIMWLQLARRHCHPLPRPLALRALYLARLDLSGSAEIWFKSVSQLKQALCAVVAGCTEWCM